MPENHPGAPAPDLRPILQALEIIAVKLQRQSQEIARLRSMLGEPAQPMLFTDLRHIAIRPFTDA